MSTAVYTVTGMTCGHCVSSVTEEVSDLPGVDDVQVDLSTSRVTVTGERADDADAVKAAVAEAGYSVVEG